MNSRAPNSRTSRSGRPRPSRSRDSGRDGESLSRVERKETTRRAIITSALALLEQHSFSALSLREVARGADIAPTAFYRHFESMEALGLVLIDESFRTLRDMLRGARTGQLDGRRIIDSSVDILLSGIVQRREYWRFITRERNSGVAVLRYAIRTEIRLITAELAVDLARFPGLRTWSSEDLNILATLFVNAMISIAETVDDADDPVALDEIRQTAIRQLRMITVGVANWRSQT